MLHPRPRVLLVAALIAVWPMVNAPARAADLTSLPVVLKDHRFTPDHLTVPAGERFLIVLTNQESTTIEFESYDMKFEKIAVPDGKVTVHAGPLHPGTYKFFDDYHPDAVGIVTAQEAR
jgi:hypothetical protein